MIKFGMSEYEVNQNIIGVAIANFVVLGIGVGVAGAVVVGGAIFGLYKVFS